MDILCDLLLSKIKVCTVYAKYCGCTMVLWYSEVLNDYHIHVCTVFTLVQKFRVGEVFFFFILNKATFI